MVATCATSTNAPELTVSDTHLLHNDPMISRRFSLPPRYHDKDHLMFVDQDRLDSDGPLIADPTQAILVVEFSKIGHESILLVVRINTLIEHVCSTRTDVHLPWDEWGRNAVIMEDLPFGSGFPFYVHGTHLVMVLTVPCRRGLMECHRARTFDFGRRRCGAMPFWDEEDGGTERKASFFVGSGFVFEVAEAGNVALLGSMRSLGNGNFFQVIYSRLQFDRPFPVGYSPNKLFIFCWYWGSASRHDANARAKSPGLN